MRIIRDFTHCATDAKGAVVALGNFDGVHAGHKAILRACVDEAKRLGVAPAVMTFFPHPREFFGRGSEALRLQSFRQKMLLFAEAGIRTVFVVRFNARFASLTAESFVGDVLSKHLQARHIVTGYNFAFGKGRGGDTAYLAQACAAKGMGFTACAPVMHDGAVVSSSAIRGLLAQGDTRQAAALLGRLFSIEGRIIHGEKRGKAMGYPTANIALGKLFRPRYGVYAVRVTGEGMRFDGVANLGIRPMFEIAEPLLEVHGFDISANLYGRRVQVALVEFIREERYFDSLEGLSRQIAEDEAAARQVLRGAMTWAV